MNEHQFNDDWVDRYVRNELSGEDESRFEESLLLDASLQAKVNSLLGVQMVLQNDDELAEQSASQSTGPNAWTPLAMAASIALAVVSTTLLWRAGIENNQLEQQLADLQKPTSSVMQIPVNIMRSNNGDTPDVIVQVPGEPGVIVLDIQLSPGFEALTLIDFSLHRKADQKAIFSWQASPEHDGRSRVVLRSESIPVGLLILKMADPDSEARESRLIEFRTVVSS